MSTVSPHAYIRRQKKTGLPKEPRTRGPRYAVPARCRRRGQRAPEFPLSRVRMLGPPFPTGPLLLPHVADELVVLYHPRFSYPESPDDSTVHGSHCRTSKLSPSVSTVTSPDAVAYRTTPEARSASKTSR